jgi:Domain of unknown function (DUF932).
MISDTQQMATTKGTLFGAYNAVTGYFQNVRNYRDGEAKLQSIVMGGTAQLKTQKAFELCTDFAYSGAEIFQLQLIIKGDCLQRWSPTKNKRYESIR